MSFALLPHYERVSFACAAFIISWLRIRHWFLSDANVLKCCKSCLLRSRFPTPCRSLSRVVGSVVRGRPCQPAVGVMYSSIAIFAGVSCAICITRPNRPHRALMADTLIGPHSHLSYRILLEIFSGYLMPMTCLSWHLWNESKRAHSVGVSPHVLMLYMSIGTIKALYSLRRSPSDMLRFLTQWDHSLWKATAA